MGRSSLGRGWTPARSTGLFAVLNSLQGEGNRRRCRSGGSSRYLSVPARAADAAWEAL